MSLNIQDTTYAGEVVNVMITRTVTGADTINKGCIMIQDGIKKEFTIPRVEVKDFMQKRAATPTTKGTYDIDAKKLTPLDVMLYTEFNPRDFEAHWFAVQMNTKLLDAELPATAEAYITMQQMNRLAEWFDYSFWQSRIEFDPSAPSPIDPTTKGAPAAGTTYDSTGDWNMFYWDGLIKKALADVTTVAVGSPIALTTSNILAEMARAHALIPKALLFKYGPLGTKFLMSYEDKNKYEAALIALAQKGPSPENSSENRYRGYTIEVIAGIPENTFFIAVARPDMDSNLWVGWNSAEDMQLELKRLQNNSELYFLKGLFKVDTQIGFNDQLVIYTTQTN